ncbi:Protein tweety -like protein 1 [Toxocara canis]|uniref:Protein tweety homolog n=1 Tax=Toxocara canis TaxID=6265 RepID=A0A0B2VVI0_TOXCA|nr:Protein tweety -like protein 1 [Toxocara canis]
MAAEFVITILHQVPHFSFAFQSVDQPFTLQFDSEYVQSLLVLVAASLAFGGILLLTIIITWICQCCARQDASVKSRHRVRQLSTLLFIISVICFFCLGFCLFGNEHLNRAVTASITGVDDVARNFKLAVAQCNTLNDTRLNTSRHIDSLSTTMRREADKTHDINKTMLNEAEMVINSLNEKVDIVGADLTQVKSVLSGIAFLEQTKLYSERIELERWILCVTLLSIMLVVLFAGVIAFCRQSKKGAVVFSGLGFAIFIVGWMLLAVIFPATVSLADFCAEGGSFIRSHLSNETIETLNFYRSCDPRPTHDNVPSMVAVTNISDQLSKIHETEQKLDAIISKLFNGSDVLSNGTRLVADDITRSLKGVGALETTIACYAYHSDVNMMANGLCNGAVPSDYVEVDDEDPFFPRGNDSTIPVDIYGTHVYNPRTRFANSLDRTEPSTGTTTATGAMPNGTAQNHPSASTALLEANEQGGTSLWQRGVGGHGSAPASTTATVNNAPPAVGTNSMMRSGYQAASNDEAAYRYRNYQEQFDV